MTRVLAIGAVVICALVVAALAVGASGDDGAYRVRAIFMNASFLVEDVDVKVAGVKVGQVEEISVTDENRAAVVLRIDDEAFQNFRRDAECAIRPQSLIGDKYVECTLTQERPPGQPLPPPAQVIPDGEDGEGQRLVPVEQTSKPIDPDLVVDTFRMPFRQRLSVILNELGAGLAGQGEALRQAIRNADPALKETDKVVKILAGQNRVLADLARDSDRVLAPLARDRDSVTGFITNAQVAAEATAEREAALEESIRLLPPFLRELEPTMERLGGLADEMTPVLSDVGSVAPDVNRFVTRLEPFSRNSLPAFRSLGEAADRGRPALKEAEPFFETLDDFTITGEILGEDLRDLAVSLRDTGGIERLVDLFFYLAGSTNGFDQFGHYFRVGLVAESPYTPDDPEQATTSAALACLNFAAEPNGECNANFYGDKPEDAKRKAAEAAEEAEQEGEGNAEARAATAAASELGEIDELTQRIGAGGGSAQGAPDGDAADDAAAKATAGAAPASSTDTALLDYLLGG
jgi:ABC-type transporter Mla subunit MlaD